MIETLKVSLEKTMFEKEEEDLKPCSTAHDPGSIQEQKLDFGNYNQNLHSYFFPDLLQPGLSCCLWGTLLMNSLLSCSLFMSNIPLIFFYVFSQCLQETRIPLLNRCDSNSVGQRHNSNAECGNMRDSRWANEFFISCKLLINLQGPF